MKYFTALLICFLCFNTVYAKEITQADILQNADNDLVKSNKHFDEVCTRIRKNFASDKDFLQYFNKDVTNYKEYRLLQRDMVLPHEKTLYGMSRYFVLSPRYLVDLNNQKIDFYKTSVSSYCAYNLFLPEEPCKEEKIKAIFK